RASAFGRVAHLRPNDSAPSVLTPAGWSGGWFSRMTRHAERLTLGVAWERPFRLHGRTHDVTATGEMAARSLRGSILAQSLAVLNGDASVQRSVTFGPQTSLRADDHLAGAALRDVWRASDRFEVDAGVRVDSGPQDAAVPSARLGFRYGLDTSGRTTLRSGI